MCISDVIVCFSLFRLRTMLKDANRRSKNPVDLEDLLDLSDEGDGKKCFP